MEELMCHKALWVSYSPLFHYFDEWTRLGKEFLPKWKKEYRIPTPVKIKPLKESEPVQFEPCVYHVSVTADFDLSNGKLHVIAKSSGEQLEQTLTFAQLYYLSDTEKPQ